MRLRSLLLASATGVVLALAAGTASAIVITGTSQGSFDDLDDCRTNGSKQDCRIADTSSQGDDTQVQWGSTTTKKLVNPSTLTAVDLTINLNADGNDVAIARLDWYNSATRSDKTPDELSFEWSLSLSFNLPNTTSLSHVFNLTVDNDGSSNGDTISGFLLSDLSGLVFDLNGITVSDLKYSVADGSGSCSGSDTTFGSDVWYNCEGNTASIYITADLKATESASTGIPEPGSVALLTAGLLGLGVTRRRRRTAA